MSYAVLITGQTKEFDTLQQHLIITHNGNTQLISRVTNGGRGSSNAWLDNNYQHIVNTDIKELIVGEVLSTPLSDVDKLALERNERPIVLIQKLTKQFNNRQKNIGSRTIGDVMFEIDTIINTDPNQLERYRSDGRKEKIVTTNHTPIESVIPIAPVESQPVIQVVRQAPTSEVIGDYVITVPTDDEVGYYIPRKLTGGVSEHQMYETARKNKYNILLEGGAGTGKTSSPKFYAKSRGQGCYVVSCSAGVEVGHFIGKTIIKPNGEAGWVDGVLLQAMKHGDILVIDEIDFATPKILQRLQEVLQSRTLGVIENGGEVVVAHPDFMIVATYNNGYKHSHALNEALLDRFRIKQMFDYDETIEKQLIKSPTLLQLANQMRADSIAGIYRTPISLRLLLALQSLSKELGYEFAVDNFLMSFNAQERPSVKLLFEAHRSQLEEELTGKVFA